MLSKSVPLRIRVVLSIATCVLVAGTGLAGVVGAWRNSAPATTNMQQQLLPTGGAPAEIVRFTVYDAGIFPREARASAGVVALHFEDMSGGSAGLIVVSESLQAVGQVVRPPQRWRENARIALVAGSYTVYDASRPLNRATLIIDK